MVSECLATAWWCSLVESSMNGCPGGWSASVLPVLFGGWVWNLAGCSVGVVLAHCWVLRDHTGLRAGSTDRVFGSGLRAGSSGRDLLEASFVRVSPFGGVRVLVGVVFGC